MNDLWTIAGGAGLRDGLNPCIFMASCVFIVQEFWLAPVFFNIVWLRSIFGLTYFLGFLVFNFGVCQNIVLHKEFILTAKILYLLLSAAVFTLGFLFFKEWFLLRRGKSAVIAINKDLRIPVGLRILIAIGLAVVLSSMATLWPISKYIYILGNAGIIKGIWQSVMPLLVIYVLMSMWPLWFVWMFLNIKRLRPSMMKIFCAAIFFTASSCMILIFK